MADVDDLSLRVLARKLVVGIVLFTAVVAVLGWLGQPWIEAMSEWFVDHFGLLGIFFGVLILDTLPGTINEPLLILGYTGGLGFLPIWAAASLGSILSGFVGYGIGALLTRSERVHELLVRHRIIEFMSRYGVYSLVIAGLTPLPYSLCTWGAGATHMKLSHLLIGTLFRIPKIGMYLAVTAAGWHLST